MNPEIRKLDPSDASAVDAAVARAREVLASGGLVVLPTETVYGIAGRAASASARQRLAEASGRSPADPSAWHAGSSAEVLEAVRPASPLHRRVIERLAPGPVRLVLAPEVFGAGAWPIPGLPEGAADRAGVLTVRVPANPIARAILRASGPVVVDRAPGPPELVRGAELVLVAGAPPHGTPSTVVELGGTGPSAGYRVAAEGALPERLVHQRVARRILFVCTGNTCRSPMAEAIARARLSTPAALLGGVPTLVASAGVAATEGEPSSPQNDAALRALGVPPVRRRSRAVSAEEVREADVIFAMTRSHARSVAALAPEAAGKVVLLDPSGADVPDPVGGSAALYISTARRLDAMIAERFAQIERTGGPT